MIIQTFCHNLSCDVFLDAGNHSGRLQELSRVQVSQQDAAGQLTDRTLQLLASYNNIVSFILRHHLTVPSFTFISSFSIKYYFTENFFKKTT